VVCDGCNADCPRRDFSKGQLRKPYPRCYDCTQGTAGQKRALDYDVYECNECGRQFSDENALAQHRHTHRARSFPCPGCGQLYRGMTDAASHFESGGCSACRDKEQARRVAYERVAQTAGSSNFLVNPHMLTHNGESGGGYSAGGANYVCHACKRTFSLLASLMQHTENRPACRQGKNPNVNLQLTHHTTAPQPQRLKFFHGTTWQSACSIHDRGFIPSQSGCLGEGTYVAREDKARRFAELRAMETGGYGGLVELLVTVRNPKYVIANDYHWQSEGYDACRAERTSASTNIEWCIRDPSAIEVIRIETVYG